MGGTQSAFDDSGPEESFAAGQVDKQPLGRAVPPRGLLDSGAANPAGRIASPAAGLAATNAFAANRFDPLRRRDDIGFDEFGGTLDEGALEAAPRKPRPLGDTIFGDASMKTPWWRSPTMPAVDDSASAANRRLADSLSNRSNEGELPKLAARALWENGSGNAVFEHADLLRQIEAADPARATRFDHAVRQRLPRAPTPMAAAAQASQPAAAPTPPTDGPGSGKSPRPVDPVTATTPRNTPPPPASPPVTSPGETEDSPPKLQRRDTDRRGQGLTVVAALREIGASPDKLDTAQRRKMRDWIETTFPHATEIRTGLLDLLQGQQDSGNARDRKGEAELLQKLEAKIKNPATLRAQRETADYFARYSKKEREEIAVKRGELREIRDPQLNSLLDMPGSLQKDIERLAGRQKAAAAGDQRTGPAIASLRRRIAGWSKKFAGQIEKVIDSSTALAKLPTHPNPDSDLDGANRQNALELRGRRTKELAVNASLFAAGGITGIAAKSATMAKTGRVAGAAAEIAGAAVAYNNGFNDSMRKVYRQAGIDMTDPAALKTFVENNPNAIRNAVRAGLTATVTGIASGATAKLINKSLNDALGPLQEQALGKAVEVGVKQVLPRTKERKK